MALPELIFGTACLLLLVHYNNYYHFAADDRATTKGGLSLAYSKPIAVEVLFSSFSLIVK